jgi:hypothetical protein
MPGFSINDDLDRYQQSEPDQQKKNVTHDAIQKPD